MVLDKVFALCLGGNEVEDADIRAPLLELFLPVGDYSLRHHYHKVAFDFFEFTKECQESNRLNRLAESLHKKQR